MDRYNRNENTLSHEQNLSLRTKKVCVIGCGGLGGLIIELLGRAGILSITAVDSDTFEVTNLNRQLFSTVENIGNSKALEAKKRMQAVNPDVALHALDVFLTQENAKDILAGHDLVIDALDCIKTRLMLEREAHALGIPLVHGAIAGWYGQVAVSYPGDYLLQRLYGHSESKGIEKELGNPPFTPACIASMQVAEAVKVLIGCEQALRNKVCYLDLLENEMTIIPL